ncbi:MAG: methyltransferase [Phycisphaerae bacterium]|nr:methyltransferase [Phycisphaerae bacterium]
METEPRQFVRQTLEFRKPPRLPRQLWLLPWANLHFPREATALVNRFPDDILHCPAFLRRPCRTQGVRYLPGTYVDEWGCTFTSLQAGIIGQVKTPLITDWSEVEYVRPPVEALDLDVERINGFCRQTGRFVLGGCCPRPFERLQFLCGAERVYVGLARRVPELLGLLRTLHDFYTRELEAWARTDVDGLMIMDDWGGQHGMLVSPAVWRTLFKRLYADYIDIAHRHGKSLWMHSDGHILDILPDLVELGLDAINCQVACMGVAALGERFRGRITFWGELDRQHLLPHGTRAEVIAAVRKMKAALYQNGGLIAQCEFGPGAQPDNVAAVFEAFSDA